MKIKEIDALKEAQFWKKEAEKMKAKLEQMKTEHVNEMKEEAFEQKLHLALKKSAVKG